VVERLPIGVIVFSKRSGEVVFANRAAQRLLHPVKIRRGTELPEPWEGFSLRGYARRLDNPGVAPDEDVEVGRDHVYRLSGITARETNSGVILVEDVSARERRSRAEREFVANAAHELLTPLTGIVGAAHVLQAGAKDVPEERDRFIEHIAYECNRLTRIARSLLVLARAQSGEEPPRLDVLPLGALLHESVDQSGAEIAIRCDEGLTVFTDADLFTQAVANLIANAVRHGSGGENVIEARPIADDLVQIDVRDTSAGAGDVGDFLPRFRTAAGRDGGGFGLGLSIAYQSLEAVGARLGLEGGSARIELPRGGTSK
jgi:signal transduction histidine kinase